MDTIFLSQCVREVFVQKKEVMNCICTRDIINGLIDYFHISKSDINPYFLEIEKELKKCMHEAGWSRVSISTYRQVIHNIFCARLIHYRDNFGEWRNTSELGMEQKLIRDRLIKEAVNMVIEFYQPAETGEKQEYTLIETEQLYNQLFSSDLLDRFGVDEFFFAIKEIHYFLKCEGFIEEGLQTK